MNVALKQKLTFAPVLHKEERTFTASSLYTHSCYVSSRLLDAKLTYGCLMLCLSVQTPPGLKPKRCQTALIDITGTGLRVQAGRFFSGESGQPD